MTKRKTTSELIAELDMKESQIHERIKALKQREREEERSGRTGDDESGAAGCSRRG